MCEPAPQSGARAASILLGMDTGGPAGSLALARAERDHPAAVLSQRLLAGRRLDDLITHMQQFLSDAALSSAELNAIVVVSGPGSFTGLRIGIAAAKALAEAWNLPLIAVSRLALLAGPKDNTAAVLDAGRGEYFFRMPPHASGIATESLEDAASLARKASGMLIHVCDPALQEALQALAPTLVPTPTAADAILYALPRFFARDFADVAALDANYVRRPYADPAAVTPAPCPAS